jgi:two-component system LytT family response regulator
LSKEISAVIIDDEQDAIDVLAHMLREDTPYVNILNSTTDSSKAFDLINREQPQVVFLDIEMPNQTGFDLLDRFDDRNFYVVFYTTHEEYAIDAIRRNAFDFLLKPVDPDDLISAMARVSDAIQDAGKLVSKGDNKQRKLEVKMHDKTRYISHDDIVYITASGSYADIFTKNGERVMVSKNLKMVHNMLDNLAFCRVHNSSLVNVKMIKTFHHTDLVCELHDGTEIKVSKSRKDELRDMMIRLA